jgi:hypothetical protein
VYRRRSTALVALAASCVLTGPAAVAATTAKTVPNVCGSELADYTGSKKLDAPFTEVITNGTTERPFTLTPLVAGANLIRTEVNNGRADDVTMSGGFELFGESDGRGHIIFFTSWGPLDSTSVECSSGTTRVIKIHGQNMDGSEKFELTRH